MSKIKRILLMIVVNSCLLPNSLCAQNKADTLKSFLTYAGTDTERISILSKIADFYATSDSSQLQIAYLHRAFQLAQRNKLENREAQLARQIDLAFLSKQNFDSALVYAKRAEELYLKNGPEKKLTSIYLDVCNIATGLAKYQLVSDYYKKLLALGEKLHDSLAIHNAYNVMGTMYFQNGEFAPALEAFNKALDVSLKTKVYLNALKDYTQIGSIYAKQGANPQALQAFQNGLKINSEYVKLDKAIAILDVDIGNIYNEQKDTAQSLKYYREALAIFGKMKANSYVAVLLGNIGNAYMESGDYKNAEKYELQSMEQVKKYGDNQAIANNYTNVGEFYFKTKQYDKSLDYYNRALSMEDNDPEARVYVLSGLSEVYEQKNDLKKALEIGEKGLELARSIGLLYQVRDISKNLSELSRKLGQSDKAFDYFKLYEDSKDSLDNKEAAKKLIRTELNYEYEQKQQAEKLEDEKKEALNAERANHERKLRNLYLAGIIVVLILTILVFRNLLRVRKANKTITEQKVEVEQQKSIVEQKNRDITDSINYARRIQQAMLPTIEQWDHYFKDSFIYYKPKDIVSGDFYWCMGSGDEVVFSVADCTGHGVPGAFMSMLGISSLNKIVGEKGIKQPDKVLNELRDEIITSLNPEGKKEEVKDGMDMTLCYLNRQHGELEYAAANNPLWIIRKNGQNYELKEYHADKMPVGKYVEDRSFTGYKAEVKKGDRIYVFTDGYADQFGGEKGKKFKYKHLQEVLLACQDKSMNEQKEILERTMEQWKGSLEQVDDMLVIGIEV